MVGPLVHAYNCTRHDNTSLTPYELLFSRRPRLAIDVVLHLIGESNQHQKLKTQLDHAYNLVSNASKSSQQKQKSHYDMTNDSGEL